MCTHLEEVPEPDGWVGGTLETETCKLPNSSLLSDTSCKLLALLDASTPTPSPLEILVSKASKTS